jgi:tetratricopeptide (TPR) repeat protein
MRHRFLARCRSTLLWTALLACTIATPTLIAHGDLHQQIAEVTARIRKDPRNPLLYVERGQLYRTNKQYRSSLADCARALRLDPVLKEAHLCRVLTLAVSAPKATAVRELTAVLDRYPDAVDARVARARLFAAMGRFAEADQDYAAAVSRHASPDWYLEWSAALKRGRHPRAIVVLDEGIATLGPIVTLQDAAIDLDVAAGRYDAALARVDTVVQQIPKSPLWLVRKAVILERAKRLDAAQDAYLHTIAVIEKLPGGRRTRAVEQVLVKARAGAARTGRGNN